MIFNKMRDAVNSMMREIHNQAFNLELSKGTLPKDKFIYYLLQDSHYLTDYSKALAITAAKLPCNKQAEQFIQFSLGAIKAEQSLHTDYLNKNKFSKILAAEQNPACFMYTNYLLKTASLGSVEEAAASLLPCFWVYREVGKNIAKNQRANNPYKEWIDLYSSDQFDLSVETAINITIELGNNASETMREKMISAFVRSTQLEWLFWDSAYQQEKWLIGDEECVVTALT